MVGDHRKATLFGWGVPNKVSSHLILLSFIFSFIDQIAQPLFNSLHFFSPTLGGVTSERRHLLSVPLSAGDAAPRPSGRLIGQVEVEQRPLSTALCWRWSSHLRPRSPGPPISMQLQNGILKKESSSRLLATFHFNIYFSAVAAC